jgi:hypothetical protein
MDEFYDSQLFDIIKSEWYEKDIKNIAFKTYHVHYEFKIIFFCLINASVTLEFNE